MFVDFFKSQCVMSKEQSVSKDASNTGVVSWCIWIHPNNQKHMHKNKRQQYQNVHTSLWNEFENLPRATQSEGQWSLI